MLVIAVIILLWPAPRVPAAAPLAGGPELIARGAYVAAAADCVACHTVEGGREYAGGRAFKLPFGTIYAPNITPDPQTGIGNWTDGEFLRAVHRGVGRDGRQLYPAFPYTSYSQMTSEDALAVKAYLFSLPPVRNQAPPNDLAFPFDQRRLMRFWNILFMPGERFEADPSQPAEWNRGAYLATALGHCGECHTPRNFLYGLSGKALSGETIQGWTAWNITSDSEHGIGSWSEDELVSYFRDGFAAGRGVASGPMKEAVDYSLSKLTPEDRRALAVYLKTVAPVRSGPVPADPPQVARDGDPAKTSGGESNALGRQVFDGACASCHARTGEGLQTPLAALRGLRSVADPAGLNVMQIVLHGGEARGYPGHAFMPAFRRAYTDSEIAATTNYVIAHFGGQKGSVTPEDVGRARGN